MKRIAVLLIVAAVAVVAACKDRNSEAAAGAIQDHLAAALQRSLGLFGY